MDPFFVTFFLPFIQNVIYDCAKYLFLKGVNNVKNQNKFKNAKIISTKLNMT